LSVTGPVPNTVKLPVVAAPSAARTYHQLISAQAHWQSWTVKMPSVGARPPGVQSGD
jgi:hypothetical protein